MAWYAKYSLNYIKYEVFFLGQEVRRAVVVSDSVKQPYCTVS